MLIRGLILRPRKADLRLTFVTFRRGTDEQFASLIQAQRLLPTFCYSWRLRLRQTSEASRELRLWLTTIAFLRFASPQGQLITVRCRQWSENGPGAGGAGGQTFGHRAAAQQFGATSLERTSPSLPRASRASTGANLFQVAAVIDINCSHTCR